MKYRRTVQAKNQSQADYLLAMERYNLTFGIGAAGCGKTYLAASTAAEYLQTNRVDKLILVRPAVANEDIGFLPGTLEEKLDPYMKPLFDALEERIGIKQFNQMLEFGTIEVAPLAFMRGRTFNRCFLILDEAQNTTPTQMKMFLTRFGEECRCVVTGDTEQTDVKDENGLTWAIQRLQGCPAVSIIQFNREDSVRSTLVQQLLRYI